MGTLISTVLTTLWVEPFVIYKYHFKECVTGYYLCMAWYFVQTAFAWAVAHFACVRIEKISGIAGCIPQIALRLVVVTVVMNGIFLIININNKNFRFLLAKFFSIIKIGKSGENGVRR